MAMCSMTREMATSGLDTAHGVDVGAFAYKVEKNVLSANTRVTG
jgi:hypothetical protein